MIVEKNFFLKLIGSCLGIKFFFIVFFFFFFFFFCWSYLDFNFCAVNHHLFMLDCQFLFYVWFLPSWTKQNHLRKKLFSTCFTNINLVCFINKIHVLFCFAGLWCDEISRTPSWRGWCPSFCNRYWIFRVDNFF